MKKDLKLTTKQNQLKFNFNELVSSYQSILSIVNTSEQPLYFKIVSTFGKLLSYQQLTANKIQPFKTLILLFRLKIPNQIKKNGQKLKITYSNMQLSSKIQFFDDNQLEVKISFTQNLPEQDEVISQILRSDCKELCEEASQLFKMGQIKKALYKYQESFLLFRELTDGLYGMAECLYILQNWYDALQAIQTALLQKKDENYIWLKIKIVYQIFKEQSIVDIRLIRKLRVQIMNLTKIQNIEQKKKEILHYLQIQQNKINSQKGGKLMYQFVQKALKNYQTDQSIRKVYPDRKLFQKQLHEVLKLGKSHNIEETPQYILDPITYQIMSQPFIVPSGHSFQRKSLWSYIIKHGNKDLYTRQQLRYQWSRPNLALQLFIKNNPNLNRWRQYQNEITTFK